jgi:hypothetical protein
VISASPITELAAAADVVFEFVASALGDDNTRIASSAGSSSTTVADSATMPTANAGLDSNTDHGE